jgi:hypothetical protein
MQAPVLAVATPATLPPKGKAVFQVDPRSTAACLLPTPGPLTAQGTEGTRLTTPLPPAGAFARAAPSNTSQVTPEPEGSRIPHLDTHPRLGAQDTAGPAPNCALSSAPQATPPKLSAPSPWLDDAAATAACTKAHSASSIPEEHAPPFATQAVLSACQQGDGWATAQREGSKHSPNLPANDGESIPGQDCAPQYVETSLQLGQDSDNEMRRTSAQAMVTQWPPVASRVVRSAFSQHLVVLAKELERQELSKQAACGRVGRSEAGGTVWREETQGHVEKVSMRPGNVDTGFWVGGEEGEFDADDEECPATPPDNRPATLFPGM